MMETLGFRLVRTFNEKIEPEGQIDSLIFKIDNKVIAIFHTIDLLYARFVDVTISIKTDQSLNLLLDFRDLLEKEGLKIKPVQCGNAICYKCEMMVYEIEMISTKKTWVQGIVGGALNAGGIAAFTIIKQVRILHLMGMEVVMPYWGLA